MYTQNKGYKVKSNSKQKYSLQLHVVFCFSTITQKNKTRTDVILKLFLLISTLHLYFPIKGTTVKFVLFDREKDSLCFGNWFCHNYIHYTLLHVLR